MRTAYILLMSGLALVACGDDDESTPAPPQPATTAGDNVTAPTPATSDGDPGSTAAAVTSVTEPAAATDVPMSSAPVTAPPSNGASSCSVTITGAVSAGWTSNASGPQAFVYGGWLTNPSPEDASAFGLNCFDSDFNIIGFFSSLGTEIPTEPATYQLTAATDPAIAITAEVALLFDEGLWEATSGTLEILEFDDAHIRGRFSLTIHDSFDNTRTADVSGEFTHSR